MLIATCLLAMIQNEVIVVDRGYQENAKIIRSGWLKVDDELIISGTGKFVLADARLGDGDWTVTVELALDEFEGTAASLVFDSNNHFGFDGRGGGFFLEGRMTKADERELKFLEGAPKIGDGERFAVSVKREDGSTTFSVNGQALLHSSLTPNFTTVALRPHRSTMRIHSFKIEGDVSPGLSPVGLKQTDVFVSGEGGYDTYRIPSLTTAPNGDLLAFCEGRKNSSSDTGDIDMLLRRSKDDGKTWLPVQTIWDDGENTCGNPCVVVDEKTETVHLLMTHNLGHDHESEIIAGTSEGTRTIWITSSKDSGETWSKPREITSSVKKDDWTWYATGPGAGIQMKAGKHKSRLIIPADHIERDTKKYYSHVIYSDDGGETWQTGGSTPRDQTNECEVVELDDGSLLLNSRNYDRTKRTRQVSTSNDGGLTWHSQHHDEELIEPICQASIRRWYWPARSDVISDPPDVTPGMIAFSNPASQDSRSRMTIKLSEDNARTCLKRSSFTRAHPLILAWPQSALSYHTPYGVSQSWHCCTRRMNMHASSSALSSGGLIYDFSVVQRRLNHQDHVFSSAT